MYIYIHTYIFITYHYDDDDDDTPLIMITTWRSQLDKHSICRWDVTTLEVHSDGRRYGVDPYRLSGRWHLFAKEVLMKSDEV